MKIQLLTCLLGLCLSSLAHADEVLAVEARVMSVIDSLCRSMEDRVGAVKRGQRYVESIAGRCVNVSEYRIYSTSELDKRINKKILTVRNFWKGLIQNNYSVELEDNIIDALNNLINDDRYEQSSLCQSTLNSPIDPTKYYFLYKNKKISSHPNDSFEARWGINEQISNCKKYL